MPELQSLMALKRLQDSRMDPLAGTTRDAPGIEFGITQALDGLPGYERQTFKGMEAFEPSEAELRVMQSQPDTGGMSRDMLRDFIMGKAQRGQEEQQIQHGQKLELAVEPAKIAGGLDIEQQRVANQGGLDQARLTGQFGVERERVAGAGALQRQQSEDAARAASQKQFGELARQFGGNRSLSMSGVGSIGAEPSAGSQNTLLAAITNARSLKSSPQAQRDPKLAAQIDAQLQQALSNYVANSGFSDESKSIAQEAMGKPGILDLTDVNQILDALDYDATKIPAENQMELQQLFSVLRGRL